MLTKLIIRNFKRFGEVEIELGNPVVFIGPNNSGKTTALQALALWQIGLRKWIDRREGGKTTKRTGVTINRRELINIPTLRVHALWRALRVRKGNTPIRVEIIVEGISSAGDLWAFGLSFETADQENIRCRPTELGDSENSKLGDGPREVKVAFLPPMSGLISQEDLLQPGSVERRIGEGRTSDVLRNLCYRVWERDPKTWAQLAQQIKSLFGIQLHEPSYNAETGTLSLEYREQDGRTTLDLTASGQGFRQMLLLLAYLYTNPNTTLLLDEPDAHLEILRQRQIYQTLSEVSTRNGNQLLIATHSEVILDEAAQRDLVIAFVGKPHRVSKSAQVRKALADYGYDDYYQAEQTGWVLYLEGATDLAILQVFARKLGHAGAEQALQRPFVHYVINQPILARQHFFAMREARPEIGGIAIFDRLERPFSEDQIPPQLPHLMWQRREIENYLAFPETLLAFSAVSRREALMENLIAQFVPPIALNDVSRRQQFWINTKMSDDFLTPLFDMYYQRLGIPNEMRKSDFYRLAEFVPTERIDQEVVEKLDAIATVAEQAASQRRPENDAVEQPEETNDTDQVAPDR